MSALYEDDLNYRFPSSTHTLTKTTKGAMVKWELKQITPAKTLAVVEAPNLTDDEILLQVRRMMGIADHVPPAITSLQRNNQKDNVKEGEVIYNTDPKKGQRKSGNDQWNG
jgi:hypothetical protein